MYPEISVDVSCGPGFYESNHTLGVHFSKVFADPNGPWVDFCTLKFLSNFHVATVFTGPNGPMGQNFSKVVMKLSYACMYLCM